MAESISYMDITDSTYDDILYDIIDEYAENPPTSNVIILPESHDMHTFPHTFPHTSPLAPVLLPELRDRHVYKLPFNSSKRVYRSYLRRTIWKERDGCRQRRQKYYKLQKNKKPKKSRKTSKSFKNNFR